mmetsp:Transcript_36133/g.40343  ORF Transcript_36133/g.40343 Transcript_36133/m.40343 type:complete len:97 (+) Transcript_36133:922-1212(+)
MRQQLLHDNMSDDDEDKSMGGTEQILEDTGVNNSDVEPVAMNVDVDKDKEEKSMSGIVLSQNETVANNIENEPIEMEGSTITLTTRITTRTTATIQ